MLVKLLGYRKLDFHTDRGDHIEGLNLYVCCQNPDVMGVECFKQFVGSNVKFDLEIGAAYDFQYSRGGALSSITKA